MDILVMDIKIRFFIIWIYFIVLKFDIFYGILLLVFKFFLGYFIVLGFLMYKQYGNYFIMMRVSIV